MRRPDFGQQTELLPTDLKTPHRQRTMQGRGENRKKGKRTQEERPMQIRHKSLPSSSLSSGDGFSDRSRSSLPSSSPLLQRSSSSERESASSSPPSLSSVATASRIGVDHLFRHHLHFSSVGVVHPRRVGVIISAVTQLHFCYFSDIISFFIISTSPVSASFILSESVSSSLPSLSSVSAVNDDSASCNNQVSDTFASPISTVQREIQVHTDLTSCNRQTSDTFASHVPLNAIPVFCSTVQREKQCLLYEGVSTVPLNSLPDFSPVHIGLSPTTRGAVSMEGSKKMMKSPIKEVYGSDASEGFNKGNAETVEQIIKAKGKFDFTAELEKLKEELMEADGMLADVKVKVPDWCKLDEKWLLDE
ncbi:hypothetical protein YC2023_009846 [Brassica napus]